MIPLRFRLLASAVCFTAAAPYLQAQAQDAAPVDFAALLRDLKLIRETQVTQVKQQRQSALQRAQAAAGSAEQAVAIWEDAVRAVQFDGAPKEGAGFREWKEKEGMGLNTKEGRNAAHLYFSWMALTLQRDGGMTVKDLLPQVISYAKELSADEQAMDQLEEAMKREKELSVAGKHGAPRRTNDDQAAKKVHDQILNKPLGGSVVVQWLKLGEFVQPPNWEASPGSYDGIFNTIVLPELRAQRDPRLLDYWEMRLKKEADNAGKARLSFDIDKFNSQRRPSLMWSRAEDMLLVGLKNRAVTEMVTLLKTYPKHPDSDTWLVKIEEVILGKSANAAVAPDSPGMARTAADPAVGVPTGSLPPRPNPPLTPPRAAIAPPTPAPRPAAGF